MLADLNSDSQQPPPAALSKVVIKDCRFFDCKGSIACRPDRERKHHRVLLELHLAAHGNQHAPLVLERLRGE